MLAIRLGFLIVTRSGSALMGEGPLFPPLFRLFLASRGLPSLMLRLE